MKLPMHAASSSSIQAMKGRASWRARAPRMASGNRTAVNRTKKTEIPSTPTYHEIPSSLAHTWWDTNW